MQGELRYDGMIAPCGMNCGLCIGHIREKNKCHGCREIDAYESSYGRKCIIRSCQIIKINNWKYCSDKCEKHPCQRLKTLDKRYRTKYGMSMFENLQFIKEKGLDNFLKSEEEKWTCPNCDSGLSVHRDNCLICGYKYRK
jgi:hypothetical protein